jgi:hypothetical protein
LWLASLLVCGLFVAEDPTIIAMRTRLNGSPTTRLGVDLALASLMIAYNFACARYVVSISSVTHILDAMARVDAERDERIARITNPLLRRVRRAVKHLNPFDLIKLAGARLGRSVDRIGAQARDRRFHRVAALFEDLGAVNVLGVPGASLAVSTSGHRVSRRHSMRYCVLFVASWFVGANLIGWLIGRAHALPLLGTVAIDATGAIGEAFVLLTDVTQAIGAVTIAAMIAATLRYAALVERTCRAMTSSPTDPPLAR